MIDICYNCSCKWRFEYNASKCAVIVFNKHGSDHQERTWSIGNKVITETNSFTHLGLLCDEFMSSSALMDESAKKLRGTFGSLISCGITPGEINPLTLRYIYCSVALPNALYGAPLWSNYLRTDMRSLEKSHRKCLNQIQT